MENIDNLDTILAETKDFKEYPINPKAGAYKARPLTDEEIAELDRSRKERSARMAKLADPAEVEPAPIDPTERKAALKLIGRSVAGGAVAAGSALAEYAGLMDIRLALPLGVAALAFVAFWLGAGIQWKFGGLLDG